MSTQAKNLTMPIGVAKKKPSQLSDLVVMFLACFSFLAFINQRIAMLFYNWSAVILLLGFVFFVATKILYAQKQNRLDTKDYVIAIFIILYALLAIVINGGGIGSLFVFASVILGILAFSNIDWTPRRLALLFYAILVLLGWWLIFIWSHQPRWIENRELVNPNVVGIIIAGAVMYFISLLSFMKMSAKYRIAVTLLAIVIAFFMVNATRSRGALLALGAFVFFKFFVPKAVWRNKNLTFAVIGLVILGGLLVPRFALLFLEGHSLNMRDIIWSNFYAGFYRNLTNFLFGMGSGYSTYLAAGTGQPSYTAHNGSLALLMNFGVIGFILFHGFLFKMIGKIYSNGKKISKGQTALLATFASLLVVGYIDSYLFSHTSLLFLLCGGLCIAVSLSRQVDSKSLLLKTVNFALAAEDCKA